VNSYGQVETGRRLRIIKRTREGRQIARANGVTMGPWFKLNADQQAEARLRLARGEPPAHLARVYGVSRATIHRLRPAPFETCTL
jgi:DNA invertase Pin-like site-specific DNA recombinase